MIPRRATRLSQPQGAGEINWDDPLARGLVVALNPATKSNLVTGALYTDTRSQVFGQGVFSGCVVGTSPNVISGVQSVTGTSWTLLIDVFTQPNVNAFGGRNFRPTGANDGFRGVEVFGTTGSHTALIKDNYANLLTTPLADNALSRLVFVHTSGAHALWLNSVVVATSSNAAGWGIGTNPTMAFGGSATGVALLYNRALFPEEIRTLSANPWRLFKSTPRRVPLGASITLPTLVQPTATTATGEWTATGAATLHAAINEAVPSTAEFISVASASTCTLTLAEAAYPGGANQTLAYRASSTQGSTLTVTLRQGATQIMTRTHALTGTDTLYTQTLTAPEISLIVAGPISVDLTTS